jgi:hypothetical protein
MGEGNGNTSDPMKDESVKYAWDCIWQGLEMHIKDKMIYPRVVAYAVATTVSKVNVPYLAIV